MTKALLADPGRYLLAFQGDHALFLPMRREDYAASLFLDRRIVSAGAKPVPVPVAALTGLADHVPLSGLGWIFHIAHCGSTLLARALDHPGISLVLREPSTLRQLGVEGLGDGQRLRLATAMLARRYPGEDRVIVKANVPVNLIAGDLMALAPEAPAIFLYHRLDDYLLAVLRSPENRNWVQGVADEIGAALAPWCGGFAGLDLAERAGALWLAQVRLYADALGRFAGARSLDAEQFLDAPRGPLAAAHRHFGMMLDDAAIDALAAGPLFNLYSKTPGLAFDNAARLARKAEARAALGDELRAARALVEARLGAYPLPNRLPGALAGTLALPLL